MGEQPRRNANRISHSEPSVPRGSKREEVPIQNSRQGESWNARIDAAVAVLVTGAAVFALFAQSVLSDQRTAAVFLSRARWERTVALLGGTIGHEHAERLFAEISWISLFLPIAVMTCLFWLVGATLIARHRGIPLRAELAHWGIPLGGWLAFPGLWEVLRLFGFGLGIAPLERLVLETPQFWWTVGVSGAFAAWCKQWFETRVPDSTKSNETQPSRENRTVRSGLAELSTITTESAASRHAWKHRLAALCYHCQNFPRALWIAVLLYTVVFTALNWGLYFSLRLPHGDSAMYEEHLWNLWHGKGFRSYLDQGLFLGEHLQVIHLALLPIHVVWPSQLMMELAQSLILALGAVPLYRIARRHGGSNFEASVLGMVYLLYFPLQFLDIAIDLKTFRPNALAIPPLLAAIDALERGKIKSMTVWLMIALSAQEDYAIVLGCLGAWIFLCGPSALVDSGLSRTVIRRTGAILTVGSVIYLLAAVVWIIPWFRDGATVHFARYFGDLGSTPGDLARNMIQQPGVVLGRFFSVRTLLYALLLLVPVGFLPCRSPTRLAVAFPLFFVFSLMELGAGGPNEPEQMLLPFHHFHAPLLPFIFWAAAAGQRRCQGRGETSETHETSETKETTSNRAKEHARSLRRSVWSVCFAMGCVLASGLCYSVGPLGLGFWDDASTWYWRNLYLPTERSRAAAGVVAIVPREARVASTDLIHTRFTHHERSYDYSDYPRRVNNNRPGAPPDTDYLVIDLFSPFHVDAAGRPRRSRPEDFPEYRENPSHWEVVSHPGDKYFLVLRRR